MGTSSCWSCPTHRLPVRVRSWWRSRRPASERGMGCSTAPAGTWGCAPRRRWEWRVRAGCGRSAPVSMSSPSATGCSRTRLRCPVQAASGPNVSCSPRLTRRLARPGCSPCRRRRCRSTASPRGRPWRCWHSVEVTATASAAASDRLRGLGAAEVVDYHDPNWPDQVRGRFDGALTAASGTAAAALPLVRDGGRLCSLTSDAPAPQRDITSTNLYVGPDAAQLARLAAQLSEGTLRLAPEPLPLREGPAAFTRVAAGRTGGTKIVLIP